MIMKNYVSDELMSKVYDLHKIINQTTHIITVLEEEHQTLQKIVDNIES